MGLDIGGTLIPWVINAQGHVSELGGSLMPLAVTEAMAAASRGYADVREVHAIAGRRLAELTHNEAACVTAGAMAGLMLGVAVTALRDEVDAAGWFSDPHRKGRREVVTFRSQRNVYDLAIEMAGCRLVEVDGSSKSERSEVAAVIGPQTAAIVYWAGTHFAHDALPLPAVIDVAHGLGVPVIVDAAAAVPPVSNLWSMTTELGADLAVFSGGKGLRGPQPSGFVVGRRDLVDAIMRESSPGCGIGRPMKISKETIVGLVAAVESALAEDPQAHRVRCEAQLMVILDGLSDLPGVSVIREFPLWSGQPAPYLRMAWEPTTYPFDVATVRNRLRQMTPRVAVGLRSLTRMGEAPTAIGDEILINPQTLQPGEEHVVARQIRVAMGIVPERAAT